MKRPISIPIFWKSQDHITAEGVWKNASYHEVKDVTFFDPTRLAVCEYTDWEDGEEIYGLVIAGGDEFISPLTAHQLTKAILNCFDENFDMDENFICDAGAFVKKFKIPREKPVSPVKP
jgi:hypothetical protein